MTGKQLVWVGLMSLAIAQAGAVEPWVPSDGEMANLPPYCKVKMKSSPASPDYKTWESTLGKDFMHTHHYCAGLNFLNRYYRSRNIGDKRFNLKNAVVNFNYMVDHASPSYSLMPEVYLNRGLAFSLMQQPGAAMTDLNKAIALNPGQPRAYNVLADYYVKSRQKGKALETVTEGLHHNPGTRSLQRRYTELGGKLPYPAPAVAAAPSGAETAAKPDAAAAGEPTAVNEPTSAGESAQTPAPSTEAPVTPPPIGTPKNPYCRFCVE